MLEPLEDVISEAPTPPSSLHRSTSPALVALPTPEDLYALPRPRRRSAAPGHSHDKSPQQHHGRRSGRKQEDRPRREHRQKKAFRHNGEEQKEGAETTTTTMSSSSSSSSAANSVSSSLSTFRLLAGDETDRLPTFQRSTEELHHRIQSIEKALRGAGKGLQARDETIGRLQKEIEFLRSILADHGTRAQEGRTDGSLGAVAASAAMNEDPPSQRLVHHGGGDGDHPRRDRRPKPTSASVLFGKGHQQGLPEKPNKKDASSHHHSPHTDKEGRPQWNSATEPQNSSRSRRHNPRTDIHHGEVMALESGSSSLPTSSTGHSTAEYEGAHNGNELTKAEEEDSNHKQGGPSRLDGSRRKRNKRHAPDKNDDNDNNDDDDHHNYQLPPSVDISATRDVPVGPSPFSSRSSPPAVTWGAANSERRHPKQQGGPRLSEETRYASKEPVQSVIPSDPARKSHVQVRGGLEKSQPPTSVISAVEQGGETPDPPSESNVAHLLSALSAVRLPLTPRTKASPGDHENERQQQQRERERQLQIENQQLREEKEMWQRTTTALLELLTEVPAIRTQLEKNDLLLDDTNNNNNSSNNRSKCGMVYAGEPRTIFTSPRRAPHRDHHSAQQEVLEKPSPRGWSPESGGRRVGSVGRGGGGRSPAGKTDDARHSALREEDGGANARTTAATGVESGVYVGTTSKGDSKNIWLNGKWLEQLQRLLIGPLSSATATAATAAAAGPPAPMADSSGDVLRSRDPRRDYWIPLEVFKASQAFKDTYCPSLPIATFLPYLQQLNTVWKRRMERKLHLARAQRDEAQRRTAEKEKAIKTLSRELESLKLEQAQQQEDRTTAHRITQLHQDLYGSSSVQRHPPSSGLLPGRGRESFGDSVIGKARQRCLTEKVRSRGAMLDSESATAPRGVVEAKDMFPVVQQSLDALRQRIRLHVTSPSALQVAEQYEEMISIVLSLCALVMEEEQNKKTVTSVTTRGGEAASSSPPLPHCCQCGRAESHSDHFPSEEESEYYGEEEYEEEDEEEFEETESGHSSAAYSPYRDKSMSLPGARHPSSQHPSQSRKSGKNESKEEDESDDPVVERLLCVVQHTCDGILQVASDVQNKTSASTRDLTRFLSQLRQVLGQEEEEEERENTAKHYHDQNDAGRREPTTPPEGGQGAVVDLNHSAQETSGFTRTSCSSPFSNSTGGGSPAKQYRTTLFHVIESVLDYSEDVLADVKKATDDLRLLTHGSIKEAERTIQ